MCFSGKIHHPRFTGEHHGFHIGFHVFFSNFFAEILLGDWFWPVGPGELGGAVVGREPAAILGDPGLTQLDRAERRPGRPEKRLLVVKNPW